MRIRLTADENLPSRIKPDGKRNLGRDAVLAPSQSILVTNYEKNLKFLIITV